MNTVETGTAEKNKRTAGPGRDAVSAILFSLLLPFIYALSSVRTGTKTALSENKSIPVLLPLCSLVTAFAAGCASALSAQTAVRTQRELPSDASMAVRSAKRRRLTRRGAVLMQAVVTLAAFAILPTTAILTKSFPPEAVGTVCVYLVLTALLYPGVLAEAAAADRRNTGKVHLFLFVLALSAFPVFVCRSDAVRRLAATTGGRAEMLSLAAAAALSSLPIASRRTAAVMRVQTK